MGPATAATINVAAGLVAIAADGQCSLLEALENATNNAATHANCTAGSGADTIVLASGSTYTLTARHNGWYGGNGLPLITDDVTIVGNGATIVRSSATPFRLFAIAPGARLAASNLNLQGGLARGGDGGFNGGDDGGGGGGGAGMGGAVVAGGTVELANVARASNSVQGGNGGNGTETSGTDDGGGGGGGGMGGNGGADDGDGG
ncbi:MAG: hypothetical protein KAX84_04415, partial [Burkholderiales bacterium]|nr:hypothetical protein [Burkholderiales bacterium]